MKFFATLFAATLLALTPVAAQAPFESVPSSAPYEQVIDYQGKATSDITEAKAGVPVYVKYRKVITGDLGGSLVEYIQKYNQFRQDGVRVRVDDLCMSACTLVTGLMSPRDVCVSEYTQFAFHSAYVMTMMGPMHSVEGTKLMWTLYPEHLKIKLRALGWDGGEHMDFVYIKGTDLYPQCD